MLVQYVIDSELVVCCSLLWLCELAFRSVLAQIDLSYKIALLYYLSEYDF